MENPSHPLCLETDIIHMRKWIWPSRSIFTLLQVTKNWIVGRPGNETKECAQWWMYLLHVNFLDVSKTVNIGYAICELQSL